MYMFLMRIFLNIVTSSDYNIKVNKKEIFLFQAVVNF